MFPPSSSSYCGNQHPVHSRYLFATPGYDEVKDNDNHWNEHEYYTSKHNGSEDGTGLWKWIIPSFANIWVKQCKITDHEQLLQLLLFVCTLCDSLYPPSWKVILDLSPYPAAFQVKTWKKYIGLPLKFKGHEFPNKFQGTDVSQELYNSWFVAWSRQYKHVIV